MDIKSMFVIKRNEDAKRWEFQQTGNWVGYLVSFSECDNEDDAWIAVYKAMKLDVKFDALAG